MNGEAKVIRLYPVGMVPFQLTEQAALLLLADLHVGLGRYLHQPDGCGSLRDCPCRIRALQETKAPPNEG